MHHGRGSYVPSRRSACAISGGVFNWTFAGQKRLPEGISIIMAYSKSFKKKTSFIIIPCLLIAVVALAAIKITSTQQEPLASANWVDHYENMQSIYDKADLIVIASVIKSIPEQRANMIFTKQYLDIKKYIKGEEKKGTDISILQTGGILNGITTAEIAEAPLLELNKEYVLFLRKSNEDHYLVMGGFQGIGEINHGKIEVNVKTDEIGKVLNDMKIDSFEDMSLQYL